MNICEVDFDRLINNIKSDSALTNTDIELANRILFYSLSEISPKGDIIVVPGNPLCLDDRIIKAVDLLEAGNATYILLSGGVLLPNSTLTEAEAMYHYCIERGIEKERILIENESRTTIENIVLCAPLVTALKLMAPKIIAVSSATHIRRVLMNFHRYSGLYPDNSEFSACQSIHPSCDPSTWFQFEEARNVVATEIALVYRYISKDGYSFFEI